MLEAITAPFAHLGIRFIPTGGVGEDTMADWLKLKSVAAVGGTWIARKRRHRARGAGRDRRQGAARGRARAARNTGSQRMTAYQPATQPTLYFIGVTTAKSSIMKVFPAWARHLGLNDAVIEGIDFPLHADPAAYREAVAFIKDDPLSLGALVTTHKIDLFKACRDLFDDDRSACAR